MSNHNGGSPRAQDFIRKILAKLCNEPQLQKKQPAQRPNIGDRSTFQVDSELLQLLDGLARCLPSANFSLGDAKLLIQTCLRHLLSKNLSTNQPEKSIAESCSDSAVIVIVQMAEAKRELADFVIKQLVQLIRSFERRALTKLEPIFLAFFHFLRFSPTLVQSAKDQEVVGKLIGLISNAQQQIGSGEPKADKYLGEQRNLNYLISLSDVRLVVDQQQQQVQPFGPNTLESLKSSVRGGISSRNANFSPSKANDERANRLLTMQLKPKPKRANSEPPQDFISQVNEEVKEVEPARQPIQNAALKVPPIMVDQIQQSQNQPPVLSGLQSTSTSVMNNFFNMPHGERFQNPQHHSAVRANSSAAKNSLYKYQNQQIIAQTRLTRRQFSLARGITQKYNREGKAKMSHSPNLEHNPYSDDGNNRGKKLSGIVPQLNLNQVKVLENQKEKSNERQAASFVNVSPLPQQLSDEGDEASMQLETQLLGAGQSAEQKLKQLAIQLGESCLTNDLAALVSQKREIDLAITARKVVHKPDYINTMAIALKRSVSQLIRANSSFIIFEKRSHHQEPFVDQKPVLLDQNIVNRLVILNMIDLLLQDCSIKEARFVRKCTNLFTCFLNSDLSREQRKDLQTQELLNGSTFKSHHQKTDSSDPEYQYVYYSPNQLSFNNKTAIDIIKQHQKFDSDMILVQQSISDLAMADQRTQLLRYSELFHKCKLLSEARVIQRILQKFSFVNEDIVQTQSVNEICSYTSRDSNHTRLQPWLNTGQQSVLSTLNYQQQSPTKQSSLRFGDIVSDPRNCISQLANPNQFWSNNGIGFDISYRKDRQQTFAAESHLQRKLDGVLNQVARRIISIFNQGYEITSYDFADSLLSEITTLTTYLEEHSGRLILQQFIDTCMESVFLVKKALVEIVLETRILAMDFTKNTWQASEQPIIIKSSAQHNKSVNSDLLLDSADNTNLNARAEKQSPEEELRLELIKCQRRLRDLFSEFLHLLAIVINRRQTEETLKLLNDVFVFDEVWNESVKAFTISLFLADLILPLFQRQLSASQLEICESIRGVNIVNFEEQSFFESLGRLNDSFLFDCARDATHTQFIQAIKVLKYLKGIIKFFEQVNVMYFPNVFMPGSKKPQTEGGHVADPNQYNAQFMGLQQAKSKPATAQNQDKKQTQKDWKHVIRRVLYQLMYLIVQPNGLFYLYLQKNCLNYARAYKPQRHTQTALNLTITTHVLGFLNQIFDMPNQFTKYVFAEELMLFYIRTHYISFVKLYNKNFKKGAEEQQAPGQYVPSIELCKRHVGCLFAIAKQRNEETRRMMFQFKICSFLLQEIGLEYELEQRQKQFLKFRQQEQVKLQKPAQKSSEPAKIQDHVVVVSEKTLQPKAQAIIPQLKVGGLGFSTLLQANGKTQEELDVESLVANQKAEPAHVQAAGQTRKAPFIPSLKVGGLGLSTLIRENGKTQEEIDVERQVQLQKQPTFQDVAELPVKTVAPKKAPFIPSLKIGGLGLSTLVKDNGKTQEEIDVENLVQPQSKLQPVQPEIITDDSDEFEVTVQESHRSKLRSQRQKNNDGEGSSSSDEQYYRELERIKSQQKPKPGFKLQLGGLGLSTLVKDNGKTQEEEDVDNLVQNTKAVPQEKMRTIEEAPPKLYSRNTNFDRSEQPRELNQMHVATGDLRQSADIPMQQFNARSPDIISGFTQSQMSGLKTGLKPSLGQVLTELENSNIAAALETQELTRDHDVPAPQPQRDVTEAMLYLNERSVRPIYQDDELHVLMLSLMMCLLLKPQRGTLDELYCSQFPIDNENQNFLYLLHFHLSHSQNQSIVPKLLQKMETVSPQLAGQRLLKLLCPSLFDLSLYGNGQGWIKLAEGAYGVVYEVNSAVAEPKTVAIKKMNLPQSIYDRCVLHDIFTEITCLEEFRLESCVTDLYDYGVDATSYYIVMKKYAGSLRDWRLKQSVPMQDNLSLYLSIYREILKCFKTIHSHHVTHYDIKGDNILIDFKQSATHSKHDLFDAFSITVGDFGECHMFTADKDEFQSRNRGTEHIKSPEMLQLAIATRKDTDKYDRRKRVGTNSLSDVWGLGCLFYELLTGEVLFNTEEYFEFHVRLTQHSQQLIQPERLEKINNNVYLIDFLKYVLVRDMHLRPTIDNVLKRFEHIHALLVATSSANNRYNALRTDNSEIGNGNSRIEIASLLQRASTIMENDGKCIEVDMLLSCSGSDIIQEHHKEAQAVVVSKDSSEKHMPEMMRIMEDIFVASNFWLQRRSSRAIKLGITHVVVDAKHSSRQTQDMFQVLELQCRQQNAFLLVPTVMDFLRKVALKKGRVLFVEGQDDWTQTSGQNITLTEVMLTCLALMYQTSAYESYTLIKSQNLFFKISTQRLIEISNFVKLCGQAQTYLATYPQFSCVCGACVIILKRSHATYQNMQIVACRCCNYYKNVESSQCPSTGCNDLVSFLNTFYPQHVQKQNMLPDGKLHWGFVRQDDFMFGPNKTGLTQKLLQRQVALNLSHSIDANSVLADITEKINNVLEQLSSASIRQKYSRPTKQTSYNQVQQAPTPQLTGTVRDVNLWKLMKCAQCQVWTHAYNEQDQRYAILLNNRLKESQKEQRLGLLTRSTVQNQAVSVPILKNIKLQTPF